MCLGIPEEFAALVFHQGVLLLNPKVDIPLFDTNTNRLQLYHSPRAKILAFTTNNNDNDNNKNYL